jgi:hypothetical protein
MAHPVVVEQSRAIPVAVSDAFTKTLPLPLPTLFNRWYGPIPPIKAVHNQTGEWSAVGQTRDVALRRLERIFRGTRTDHVLDGTREVRRRWHHQKYFTWVEQQGKTVDQLRAQESPDFWLGEQKQVAELDRKIREARGS